MTMARWQCKPASRCLPAPCAFETKAVQRHASLRQQPKCQSIKIDLCARTVKRHIKALTNTQSGDICQHACDSGGTELHRADLSSKGNLRTKRKSKMCQQTPNPARSNNGNHVLRIAEKIAERRG